MFKFGRFDFMKLVHGKNITMTDVKERMGPTNIHYVEDEIWNDITSEKFRIYHFANGNLKIKNPVALSILAPHSHRIITAKGMMYYIPSDWIGISSCTRDGEPLFVL